MYPDQKFHHAFASLLELLKLNPNSFDKKIFKSLIRQALNTRTWMVKGIRDSRLKDHSNPFRKMVFETKKEMDIVIGRLEDNSFIKNQEAEMKTYKEKVKTLSIKLQL